MEDGFFHEYMGMDVEGMASVIYLKRAFENLECPHPNEDVAIFSSSLDENLLEIEDGELRRHIKQSVHLLFHYLVFRPEGEEDVGKVASGKVARILMDVLSDVIEWHEESLLVLEDCMHGLKVLMFHSHPSEDTAYMLMSSSMHMCEYLRELGRHDDACRYLLSDLSAPDYLYRNGLMDGDDFLSSLGAMHIMRGLEIERKSAGNGMEDFIIGGALFRKVGKDAAMPYVELVEKCEERLGFSLF